MKKILTFFAILTVAATVFAQDRTVTSSNSGKLLMGNGVFYTKYTGVAADTLTANQDTIDIVFQYQSPDYVKKIAVKTRFDIVAGADTTVSTSLFGKEFSDDGTYVQIIAASVSDTVDANNTVQILTSDYTESIAQYVSTIATYNSTVPATDIPFTNPTAGTADTLEVPQIVIANASQTMTNAAQTVTPPDKSYRYYRLRYIYSGDDSVGTGIKIDEIELKFYVD